MTRRGVVITAEQRATLAERFAFYTRFSDDERRRFERQVAAFVTTKRFVSDREDVDERTKLLIAALACRLSLRAARVLLRPASVNIGRWYREDMRTLAGPLVVFVLACGGSDPTSQDASTPDDGGASNDAIPSNDATNPDVGQPDVVQPGVDAGDPIVYGLPYTGGQYNLGPVDYAETQWHNACAPATKYSPAVQQVEGTLLAGLWSGIPAVAGYCDACIVVHTNAGKSALLRVVTYGATTLNSLDVSPDAYALLDSGEYPRSMTWQFAECPDTGPMLYEFQSGSSQWWTSFWVRNARVPVAKVEVQSVNHTQWTELTRGSDGTLTDGTGFGQGQFSIRTTGVDNTQVVDTFAWPSSGIAGAMLTGVGNFP